MKKRIISAVLAGVVALSLAACTGGSGKTADTQASKAQEQASSGESAQAEASGAEDKMEAGDMAYSFDINNIGEHEFTFSSTAASGSVNEAVILDFCERVNTLSEGKIKINHFGGSTLGTEEQNLQALTSGTLDMAMIAVEFYGNSIPQLNALLLPYLYEDYDQVAKVLQSEAGEYASEQILKSADVVNLAYFIQAFRNIYSKKEIKSVDDMSGLKIRVPESNLYVNTFSMMKAAPTPLPLSEVYTALDTGVVEAVENIPDTAVHNSWAEVAPYMIKTNHMNAPTTMSISNKVFSALNEDEQNLLREAGYENFIFSLEATKKADTEARGILEDSMTMVEPDIESMKSAIDYTTYEFMGSEEAKTLFDLIQKNIK